MPTDGQVDEGRGDVDRIDTLVGHRADVAGPHIADHPEFGLLSSGRNEFASLADLTVWAPVDPSPPMEYIERYAAQRQQAQRQGQRQRASRKGSTKSPLVIDHLIRRNASRGKSDVDCDYLALTARTIPEGRNLGACSAGSRKGARNCGVRATGSAFDIAELGGDLHRRGELGDLGAEPLQHPPAQRRPAFDSDYRTGHRVAHDDLSGPVRGHGHRREPILGVDRRLHRRTVDQRRDIGERLNVLPVSDKVLASLELLRELSWHRPGQNDRLLHSQRAVLRQVAFGDERRRVALSVCRQSKRTREQTTSQEAAGDQRPDPMERHGEVGGHEIQPPTCRTSGAAASQNRSARRGDLGGGRQPELTGSDNEASRCPGVRGYGYACEPRAVGRSQYAPPQGAPATGSPSYGPYGSPRGWQAPRTSTSGGYYQYPSSPGFGRPSFGGGLPQYGPTQVMPAPRRRNPLGLVLLAVIGLTLAALGGLVISGLR